MDFIPVDEFYEQRLNRLHGNSPVVHTKEEIMSQEFIDSMPTGTQKEREQKAALIQKSRIWHDEQAAKAHLKELDRQRAEEEKRRKFFGPALWDRDGLTPGGLM